jgi:DNA-binding MarR family transcriptional regulator
MTTAPKSIDSIVLSLEQILVRRFREALYSQIGYAASVPIRDGAYPVLTGLRHGPSTATELALRIGIDRTVVSRQASELIAAGLAKREADPRDSRGNLLALTPDGRKAADNLNAAVSRLVASTIDDWPEAERARFPSIDFVRPDGLADP